MEPAKQRAQGEREKRRERENLRNDGEGCCLACLAISLVDLREPSISLHLPVHKEIKRHRETKRERGERETHLMKPARRQVHHVPGPLHDDAPFIYAHLVFGWVQRPRLLRVLHHLIFCHLIFCLDLQNHRRVRVGRMDARGKDRNAHLGKTIKHGLHVSVSLRWMAMGNETATP